jgi:2-keto-3-deoxy-L-rhamnonate aldolase RhmA
VQTAVTLTLAEAAMVLSPPVSEQQLRAMVTALRWQPCGHRHTGRAGRPAPAYSAKRLLELHAAMVPFLAITDA